MKTKKKKGSVKDHVGDTL